MVLLKYLVDRYDLSIIRSSVHLSQLRPSLVELEDMVEGIPNSQLKRFHLHFLHCGQDMKTAAKYTRLTASSISEFIASLTSFSFWASF